MLTGLKQILKLIVIVSLTAALGACTPLSTAEPNTPLPAPAEAQEKTAVSTPEPTASPERPPHEPTPTSALTKPDSPATPTAETAEEIIIFARSGGYAGLNEEWTIYSDGRVINQTGAVWQTTPQAVTQLQTDIINSGFLELEENYLPKDPCCDRFTYTLTLIVAGETYQTTTIDATPTTPDAFWNSLGSVQDFFTTLVPVES